MITEKDLQEAISECEGKRNPNADTCLKLASFYIIKDHMFGGEKSDVSYSYAPDPDESVHMIDYVSDTEFGMIVSESDPEYVMSVMDELMSALYVVDPKMYKSVIRKLREG